MPDIVSPETRSRMMAGIRAKDTKPEMLIRRAVHAAGFRYRLHDKSLAGRPDLVFPRYHAVVFVHGCFWHGHAGCKYFKVPSTRTEFWTAKIEANRARDQRAIEHLSDKGWRVCVIWECATRTDPSGAVEKLSVWLRSTDAFYDSSNQARPLAPDQVVII